MNNQVDVGDTLRKYLKKNGFDGIYNPEECSCLIDDLQPCDGRMINCIPGVISDDDDSGDDIIGPKED